MLFMEIPFFVRWDYFFTKAFKRNCYFFKEKESESIKFGRFANFGIHFNRLFQMITESSDIDCYMKENISTIALEQFWLII